MAQSDIPEFMRAVVPLAPDVATNTDVATQKALMLDSAMMAIYDRALAVCQRNLLDRCPVILGLFTNAGGEFTLYRPGRPPLEAPPVPTGYGIVKSVEHIRGYFLMDVELVSTGARDAIAAELAKRVPASGGAYTVFAGRRTIIEEARKRGLKPLMPPLAPFHSQEWPWRTPAVEGEGPTSLADVRENAA